MKGGYSNTPILCGSISPFWFGMRVSLCRLEARADRDAALAISKFLVESFIASFEEAPEEVILDFDATDDRVHGKQEGRFFHGYYRHWCFLPLYVFCGEQLLVSYLRPRTIDPAKHTWAILKLLSARLCQVWPGVKIVFRGDSGFCRWKMLRWCERHDIGYVVGIAKNARLLQVAARLMRRAEREHERLGAKRRVFNWADYAADSWDRKR